jgi:hypothetical protein
LSFVAYWYDIVVTFRSPIFICFYLAACDYQFIYNPVF